MRWTVTLHHERLRMLQPFAAVHKLAGELVITGLMGRPTLQVRRPALCDGVLLGRYARCDGADIAADDSISRVQLLLVRVDSVVHVPDPDYFVKRCSQPRTGFITADLPACPDAFPVSLAGDR